MIALCAVAPIRGPAEPSRITVVEATEGCVLDWAPAGSPCPCTELPGPLRRLFGLPIPLNRADAADLEALPGIGAVRARAILAERERGGPFSRVEDLARVRGLGAASIERLRPYAFVNGRDPACGR